MKTLLLSTAAVLLLASTPAMAETPELLDADHDAGMHIENSTTIAEEKEKIEDESQHREEDKIEYNLHDNEDLHTDYNNALPDER